MNPFSFKDTEKRLTWWYYRILLTIAEDLIVIAMHHANQQKASIIILLILVAGGGVIAELMLANNSRRLRDAKFSPWWTLLDFGPLVGPIALIILCGCFPTKKHTDLNQNENSQS